MNLGNGEYLVISNCIRMPYKQLGLLELLKNIESEIKIIDNLSWFDTSINSINYELVWNGLKNYKIDKFNYEDLIKFPLSSLDIKFNNGLIGRIQIEFLDKESYELSFITNYTEIFEESIMREQVEIYANYIEELGKLAKENINFSHSNKIGGSYTIEGTQWTIASMVGQEAGIPLLFPFSKDK